MKNTNEAKQFDFEIEQSERAATRARYTAYFRSIRRIVSQDNEKSTVKGGTAI